MDASYSSSLIFKMTTSVTYPEHSLLSWYNITRHITAFLDSNPQGVRNTDVGRAMGYNDKRQWFSYGILERMIKEGKVEKRTVEGKSLYFSVG